MTEAFYFFFYYYTPDCKIVKITRMVDTASETVDGGPAAVSPRYPVCRVSFLLLIVHTA